LEVLAYCNDAADEQFAVSVEYLEVVIARG